MPRPHPLCRRRARYPRGGDDRAGARSQTRCSRCGSGPEALALAGSWQPDLILLDVMMPGMDGAATLQAARAHTASRDPVVFITARNQSGEVEQFKTMGAIGVLAKPFDPMTLGSAVRAYLS